MAHGAKDFLCAVVCSYFTIQGCNVGCFTVFVKLNFCALLLLYEPRCEKIGLLGFRPGPTQTGLYNQRRWQEA